MVLVYIPRLTTRRFHVLIVSCYSTSYIQKFLICFRPNKVRYPDQLDIHNAAGILPSQFDYSSSLIPPQQAPLIDIPLEVPSPQANAFPSDFAIPPPRNHSGMAYFPNSPANSRFPAPNQSGETGYFKYIPAERPLPGRQPHDQTYTRAMPTIPIEAAQRPPPVPSVEPSEPSTTNPPNNRPRDRREISTVVIACRQW
jgi:hypothetical protein